jgi:hypothetical protein
LPLIKQRLCRGGFVRVFRRFAAFRSLASPNRLGDCREVAARRLELNAAKRKDADRRNL